LSQSENCMMTDDARVQQLLDELLASQATPEAVCESCPDLLPVVRDQWKQICHLRADLDVLFPSPDEPTSQPPESTPLPRIPGYEIEAVIGRGGMGIVFRAKHLRLNRWVALKMALSGVYAGLHERERFQREAEAVAGLRHPNVVQIHDIGEADGRPYFTMEFLDGGSLARKLAGTPQPARQAAQLVATLAGAVQAAHACGIVHRDLKPDNVLLTGDGTPKITDLGLAKRLERDEALSLSGVPVGTPSYMAPEQAHGQRHAIGPGADVYALGAILYELLTGRPPFRAETTAATLQHVLTEDPVPPSRLNAQVPRDLETICLKCLNKDPNQRYTTAAALAADLQHYLQGEAISARRPGSLERISKWVRRRPANATLIASSVLFTAVLIGGTIWLVVQQAHRRNAIEADLREVHHLQQQARWLDAGVVLQRAEARLNGGEADALRQRMSQARSDLDLVLELDRIHLNRVTSSGDLAYYKSRANRQYISAFEKSGLAKEQDPPAVVAARVNASAVRVALLAALDDWTVCAADKSRRDWLLSVARETDPDPLGWGDRIRDPARWNDLAALSELAETVPVSGQSVSLLLALGERLRAAGGDALAFLKRVQKDHPADFWANIILGDALFRAAPVEAAGYYRAALASRPEAAVAYTALGDSFRIQKRLDEAIGYYRQALNIDPNYARGQTNLGNFLKDAGQLDEAIACYRKALQIDPNYAWAHYDLANALSSAGQFDEALEHFRQFHAAHPAIPYVENILRSDLVRRGRGEEARRVWKKALELDPPEHDPWFGYAELCLFLGDEAEYRRAAGLASTIRRHPRPVCRGTNLPRGLVSASVGGGIADRTCPCGSCGGRRSDHARMGLSLFPLCQGLGRISPKPLRERDLHHECESGQGVGAVPTSGAGHGQVPSQRQAGGAQNARGGDQCVRLEPGPSSQPRPVALARTSPRGRGPDLSEHGGVFGREVRAARQYRTTCPARRLSIQESNLGIGW
jgi:serine/threonine-protein kinase